MQLEDFHYDLPPAQIAQYPTPERTASRLLTVTDGPSEHGAFADIVRKFRPGDLLVLNNTKVVNARLFATKDSGGRAEILFERLLNEHEALCQVRVSKPLRDGRILRVGRVMITSKGRRGQFYQLHHEQPWLALMEEQGHVPLPPYIERHDEGEDLQRYQTVYGEVPGAVAAPTAGLHFSAELLAQLQAAGVELAQITLHVGAGTFQPIRGELQNHKMHREVYRITDAAAVQINAAKAEGRRVIAIGTTVVRTLESAAQSSNAQVAAGSSETQLFIKPGFQFQIVDALVTNFHLPSSTLLMLVCAFSGYQSVMTAYREAVKCGYRFFSYGDAMWLTGKHAHIPNVDEGATKQNV